MPEDSAQIPKSRSDLLIRGRNEMTQNSNIVNPFQRALEQIKKDGANSELSASNRPDLDRTIQGIIRLTKNFLGGNTSFSEENLREATEIFFSLGERLAPFYDGFAQWLDTFRSKDKQTQFIFQGRDSLGLFLAYAKRYGTTDAHYSPANRFSNTAFYSSEKPLQQAELTKLENDYNSQGSLDKKVVFVDFGFKGTVARKEILQTHHRLGIVPKDVEIALACHLPDNGDSVTHSYIPGNFPPEKYSEYQELNAHLINDQTQGYINTYFFDIAQTLNIDDKFCKALQELGSYIKETGATVEPGNKPRAQDYIMAPVYELAAKYGFIHGLKSRLRSGIPLDNDTDAAGEALASFQDIYRRYPGLFTFHQDHSERAATDYEYGRIVTEVNKAIEDIGENKYRG